jgi:CRP-like cAMP-binding protein
MILFRRMKLDADTLRRTAAFAALPLAAREALVLCFRERRYAPGEVVFSEGEPASSLYLCAEGELETRQRGAGASAWLARIGPGRIFGASALIDPTPRAASVVAVRPSVVFEMGEDAVETLRRNAPEAARALRAAAIASVVRQLRQLQQRVERELDRAGALP